jgi:hypothetical protein
LTARPPAAPSSLLDALGPIRSSLVAIAALGCAGWLAIAVGFGTIPVAPNLVNRLGGIGAGDFMFFYPVAVLSSDGRAEAVYDTDALTAIARERMGPGIPELVWPYPPTMSLLLAPLGGLRPGGAYVSWMALQLLALLIVGRLALGRWAAAPLALLFPGAALALFAGQFSPVLGVLLATAVLCLDRKPARAGAALGLFVWKPHFGAAAAVFALLDRQWRTLGTAALTGGTVIAASIYVLGTESWSAFFASGVRHWNAIGVEAPMSRFVSIFSAAATAGVPMSFALGIHALTAGLACAAARRVWTRSREPGMRALALACATLLLPPYALDYDMVLLLLPWLLLAHDALRSPRRGSQMFDLWLVLTMLVPVTYLSALYSQQSLGGPFLCVVLGLAWWRVRK